MAAGRFGFDAVRASRLERSLGVVRSHLDDHDARPVAFVHAGDDADSAYLGFEAVVVTSEEAVALTARDDATPRIGAQLDVRAADDPPGRVAPVLGELTATGTVLTPRSIRHDAALFLDASGYDLASTTALDEARAMKTAAEHDAVRALGAATTAGFGAAIECLATAATDDGVLWSRRDTDDRRNEDCDGVEGDGDPLTTARLSREVAATLARGGVETPAVRVHGVGEGTLPVGQPLVVECAPAAAGVRLRAACTLVVDGDGGWERRAQLALDAAHRAGRGQVAAALDGEPVTAGDVAAEVRAEVTAYGFGESTVDVYGVGQSARERPHGGEELEAGHVVVVAASVSRADDETVSEERRTEVVRHVETLALGDGVERVVSLPTSLSPSNARMR